VANPLIYVDSSVLIDVITQKDYYKARRAGRTLSAIAAGRARGIASWLVLAEVISAPGPDVPEDTRDLVQRALAQNTLLEWAEVERLVSRQARELGHRYPNVAGADAVHLATALRCGAEYFFTTDLKLIRKLHGRDDTSPVRVDRLIVQQPGLVWDADMFEATEDAHDREAEQLAAPPSAQGSGF
jgi:predicted nucleic acid-binding protein